MFTQALAISQTSISHMNSSKLDETYQLVVPGQPLSLALIRAVIAHLATTAGFDDVDASKIEIAVDEACANIMEHAYSDMENKPPVTVQVSLSDDLFVVEIIDEGKKFDKADYHPPTFPTHWEEGNIRGVGIYLIYQCMDTVSFLQTKGKRNQLRMIKKRPRHMG